MDAEVAELRDLSFDVVSKTISIQFLSFACFVVFHNFRLGDLKGALADSIAVDLALDLLDQDR